MSSLSNTTLDIDIRHPEHWTLILRAGAASVKFILYSDEVENSLIYRELPLDIEGGNYLKALENCIYDNPVLIQDYKRIAVSVESLHFALLPVEAGDDDTACDVLDYMFASDEGDSHVCDLIKDKVAVAFKVPHGVLSFLQRTFNMPLITHHLVPLTVYSAEKSEKSGIAKMFVHLHDNSMDMCVFRKGEFLMTNSFRFREVEETAYYMLNAWQNLGLDVMTDELQLSADKAVRDILTPQLRKYISYVMPTIFPASAMKIGQDAIKAPFDLILLSQCVL